MIRWVILIALAVIVAVLTIAAPTVLAKNTFLDAFVSHEILALLIVILTITLASVGNIHLTITRLVNRFESKAEGELQATPARNELNSNAWSLLWAFCVCLVVLLIKGGFSDEPYLVSLMNGAAVVILVYNLLVLYDIYTTVFDLVKQDGTAHEHKAE